MFRHEVRAMCPRCASLSVAPATDVQDADFWRARKITRRIEHAPKLKARVYKRAASTLSIRATKLETTGSRGVRDESACCRAFCAWRWCMLSAVAGSAHQVKIDAIKLTDARVDQSGTDRDSRRQSFPDGGSARRHALFSRVAMPASWLDYTSDEIAQGTISFDGALTEFGSDWPDADTSAELVRGFDCNVATVAALWIRNVERIRFRLQLESGSTSRRCFVHFRLVRSSFYFFVLRNAFPDVARSTVGVDLNGNITYDQVFPILICPGMRADPN